MHVSQLVLNPDQIDSASMASLATAQPQLVLAFGSVELLQRAAPALALTFPGAHRMGCSTAGEISASGVNDETLVLTALSMDAGRVEQVSTMLAHMEDSFDAGVRLATALPRDGLRTILVLGQGVHINGSAMLKGMTEVVGTEVPIAGGLAGDGGAFVQTWVLDDAGVSSDRLVCVGFYGAGLAISHGSFGGWSPFGPARKVTRCRNNVLLELDGQPALAVYKRYLGEHAKGLPASGLLFPFAMLGSDHSEMGLIRTILGIDEVEGSLTLAGDIEPNGYLRLMHASTDALVDGAQTAAESAKKMHAAPGNGLALLISCVGRKLVMGGRVDEEVEAVGEVFGKGATLAGFYSYGEISPVGFVSECKLHNQTMTITYLTEAA